MKVFKSIAVTIGVIFTIVTLIVAILTLSFGSNLWSLGMKKFFAPKFANVEREVFENTTSYVQGKNLDLAKYYEEYSKSTDEAEKQAIKNLVVMNFSSVNEEQINNPTLRRWLVDLRGY